MNKTSPSSSPVLLTAEMAEELSDEDILAMASEHHVMACYEGEPHFVVDFARALLRAAGGVST